MNVAILYCPGSYHELQSLPIASSTLSQEFMSSIYFATYRQNRDSHDIKKGGSLSRVPSIQSCTITEILNETRGIMSYCVGHSYYMTSAGDSGAAVLHFDGSHRVFHLLGIHLGHSHLPSYSESMLLHLDADSEATPAVKRLKSDTAINVDEESATSEKQDISTTSSVSTNSDVRDSQSEESSDAAASFSHIDHAQTDAYSPYFIIAHSIVNRPKWDIDFILANNPMAYADNSPPRIQRSDPSVIPTPSHRTQHRTLHPVRLFLPPSLYDE
jgi:hypothetical protein